MNREVWPVRTTSFEQVLLLRRVYSLEQIIFLGTPPGLVMAWAMQHFEQIHQASGLARQANLTGLKGPLLFWITEAPEGDSLQEQLAAACSWAQPHVLVLTRDLLIDAPGADPSVTLEQIDHYLEATGRPYSIVVQEESDLIFAAPLDQSPLLLELLQVPSPGLTADEISAEPAERLTRRTDYLRALSCLSAGQAAEAWRLLKPTIVAALSRREVPDPREWVSFLEALLCQGNLPEAQRLALQFESLDYSELRWMRAVLSCYSAAPAALNLTTEQPAPPTQSIHPMPPTTLTQWLGDLYGHLLACGQSALAASLLTYCAATSIPFPLSREQSLGLGQGGTMEITSVIGCKINCRHCPQGKLLKQAARRGTARIMGLETFCRCLEQIPRSVRLDFSGMAEPWQNRQCTAMVLQALQRGHRLAIYTTLVGLSEEEFALLQRFDYEAFVIHVPDAQNNAKIPITPQYLRLLRQVVNAPLSVKDPRNWKASSHGPLHPAVAAIVEPRLPVDYHLHDRAGNVDRLAGEPQERSGPIRCRWGSRLNRNVLLPDGSVLVCCMDYGMEHVLGNLLDVSYAELFAGEEAARLERGLREFPPSILCRRCSEARPA